MLSLHDRAKDVFLAALARPAGDRARFIADACGADTTLRMEVESLLRFHSDDAANEASDDARAPEHDAVLAPTGAGEHDVFTPGDVFAGRYRMVTRIGRGGMGDVWRADDLVLETPVALKLILSASPRARLQILNEVRLARRITHPAVCRVFDVGESGGRVFLSMELVDGEDLATLVRRVGRLPGEKVVDIARQLCAGLEAAHAQRVLHRDLKPANVLIDDAGRVRITDFGIAVPRTDAPLHTLAGTPRYMAPEQFADGARLNESTDVYALALILYELIVGQHAFPGPDRSGVPPRPSARVPNVDPRLERAIMHGLVADPAHRTPTTAAMAAMLPGVGIERRPLGRRGIATAASVAIIGIAAIVWAFLHVPAVRPLTARDTIVLADFANTTGEPVFDGALKVALAVALEQSPFMKVFPEERMRDTLRLMGRPADVAVTGPIAREIARREQLKALLVGSIGRLGNNFVIGLEAVTAESGEVMAREQVEVTSKEDVLSALGTAASRLRVKLGESLSSIQQFDAPLARATTPSLEALDLYSRALDNGTVNPRLESIPMLRRAIELDPDFALAMALLSTTYANTGRTALAPALAKRAFDLRERVSERERFFIAFRYHRDATQNWTEALELARSWTVTYPREAFAFNSVGSAHIRFGQYDAALGPLQEAIRLDPKLGAPYANLAGALMALGRFDDARALLQQGQTHGINSFPFRRMSYWLAFHDGDAPTMARMMEGSIGAGQTNAAYGWQAHTAAFGGDTRGAHEQFRRGIQASLQGGFPEVAGQLAVEDAEVHGLAGDCGQAREEVAGGLLLSRDNYTLERASRTLAWCGAGEPAAGLVQELTERYPEATITRQLLVPVAQAALAVQRGDYRRGLSLLDPLGPLDRASRAEFWPEFLRGQAYLGLGDGQAAAGQFQSILAHPGEYPNSPIHAPAQLGLARAAALSGDVAGARNAYLDFFRTWRETDADGGLLAAAQAEYGRLR